MRPLYLLNKLFLFSRSWSDFFVFIFYLQVRRDFMCLYCNDRCHPFSSLEAVRKHMDAKSHCKVHYGDGDDEEEAELEEFYDYSSRFYFLPEFKLIGCSSFYDFGLLSFSCMLLYLTFFLDFVLYLQLCG